MKNKQLIIGSRGSKLALTQAELIKSELGKVSPDTAIEIKIIKTTGDKILDTLLGKIGDKGLFTKEIEEALLADEVDLAVHSMKDLPTQVPEGLKIAAITKREDARDILVSSDGFDLNTLPAGSKVGTSSLRRCAQLLNKRDDLQILPLRGNLDTRIRKLDEGLFDAIVLAAAGVKRLGLKLNMRPISTSDMLPQAGQGALGIETRQNDVDVCSLTAALNDPISRQCIEAERALLSGLGGGCQVPIGTYATMQGEEIFITAGVFSLDGKTVITDEMRGARDEAFQLGMKLADKLIEQGAKEILKTIVGTGL